MTRMSEDYLFGAVDAVMRKTLRSLSVMANHDNAAIQFRTGLVSTSPPPVDEDLRAEDERTLEMASAALDELGSSDQKESNQDG